MSFPAAVDLRRGRGGKSQGKPTKAPKSKAAPTAEGRRWRLNAFVAALILTLLSVGGYFLLRDSSLVQVEEVRVVGLSGHYDKDARAAVTAAASEMTTLNFDSARIEEAAAQFVDVAGVSVSTDFPHTATIRVRTRRPVVIARIDGRTLTLSQDGEIFTPSHTASGLAKIDVPGKIEGNRVVAGKTHQAVQVLGAAPDILLRRVDSLTWGKLGIVVSLKDGADLYFGDGDGAKTKWKDAAAVLASDKASGAAYLDLRVPGRVAVGGIGGAPQPQLSAAASAAIAGATAAPAATDAAQPAPPQAQPQQPQSPTAPPATVAPVGGAAPAQ